LIGGDAYPDILSLFPQGDARIIGGIEKYKAWEGQQWREKLSRKHWGYNWETRVT
jgi:hypothetical protein